MEDSDLSKNSIRESANVLAVCSSSKQFLHCLGHSLACKKPQSQPFVLQSDSLTGTIFGFGRGANRY